MRLSICIVNWNTRDHLEACLRSLKKYPLTNGATEIIVVDNDSADGSAKMVAERFPDIRLIANDRNENYARATNQALALATGERILLLNPDTEAFPEALDRLVDFVDNPPVECADIVAGRLILEDGSTQASVRGFPEPMPLLFDMLGWARRFPTDTKYGAYRRTFFDYEKAQPAMQPMASCLLFTRRVFEEVGDMDERFPLYFNDVDWCRRVWDAGFAIWYLPDARFSHIGGGTTQTRRNAVIWESHRALLRFYAKHYRRRIPYLLYILINLLVVVGAWARTKRWGQSLGRNGGETTPETLHRELERAG